MRKNPDVVIYPNTYSIATITLIILVDVINVDPTCPVRGVVRDVIFGSVADAFVKLNSNIVIFVVQSWSWATNKKLT